MADLDAVLADLRAESGELDDLVAGLSDAEWRLPTPAEGWTIAHQIAHLAWTDDRSLLAVRDEAAFGAELKRAVETLTHYVDEGAAEGVATPPAELLARWRRGRAELEAALAAVPEGEKVPWYGPPMRPASMATARLMETWAHGQDVADTLGVTRVPTGRLWHVARLGVRTRDFAYLVNELDPPAGEFRVELIGPGGDLWSFGPADAAQRVTGSALDFCHVVTQRRHPADTDLRATGADAAMWLTIAQAFAGPPGSGRGEGAA